jgi:hypothetical protein
MSTRFDKSVLSLALTPARFLGERIPRTIRTLNPRTGNRWERRRPRRLWLRSRRKPAGTPALQFIGSFDLRDRTRIGAMNPRFVRGMFVKGMSLIPLTLIPLTARFMERASVSSFFSKAPR